MTNQTYVCLDSRKCLKDHHQRLQTGGPQVKSTSNCVLIGLYSIFKNDELVASI